MEKTAFNKEFDLEPFTRDDQDFLRLEMFDQDFIEFFDEINQLEEVLKSEYGGGVDFQVEFDQLRELFDEGTILDDERDALMKDLIEFLSNFSSYDYVRIETENGRRQWVEDLLNTLANFIYPMSDKSKQSRAIKKDIKKVYSEIDKKTGGYISKFEEQFSESFDPMTHNGMSSTKRLLKDKYVANNYVYKFARNLHDMCIELNRKIDFENAETRRYINQVQEKINEVEQEVDQFKQMNGIGKNDTSTELKQLERDCATKVWQLEREIHAIERDHAEKIRVLESNHHEKMNAAEKEFNNEKLGLLATIDSLREEIKRLEKEHAKEIADQKEINSDLKSTIFYLKSSLIGLTIFTAGLGIEVATGFFSSRNQEPNVIEHHQEENYQQHPLESHEYENEFYNYDQYPYPYEYPEHGIND